MTGWGEFAAAYGVFLLSHSVLVRPPIKPLAIAFLGRSGFAAAYAILSIVVLAWLIMAAGRAPYVELWPRLPGQQWITLGAMIVACQLVAHAAFRPNPLSFGGWRNSNFRCDSPGIVGWLRHPYLGALALWSAAHMAPNGDLAHVLMFGGFAVFAVAGTVLVDRRRIREIGRRDWQALTVGVKRGRSLRPGLHALGRTLAGLCLVVLLVLLHPAVIGVDAWIR